MSVTDLVGTWTYRSYYNDPAPVGNDPQRAFDLIFAEAQFRFTAVSATEFAGVIDWGSGGLDLAGTLIDGSIDAPVGFRIIGLGRPGTGTAGWEYDYRGGLAHGWAAGVQQVPALVGTVIRAKPHGGAPAGATASFIAVKNP